MDAPAPHIGLLRETPLHASLKALYTEPGDEVEVPLGRYVIDIVRGDLLIEIQTRGIRAMRGKLDALLDEHPMKIVHPIAATRTIVKLSDDGEILSRRKSPKRGHPTDVFAELVAVPTLIDHPNLGIDLVLISEDELRARHAHKGRRRGGWTVISRSLVEVLDRIHLGSGDHLAEMMPEGLPDRFTTATLAEELGIHRRVAQQMAYCLRHLGRIQIADKTGNALVYTRT